MNIVNLFKDDLCLINKKYKNKIDALKDLTKELKNKKYISNSNKAFDLALKREKEFSTGIGNKIAIPHIRDDCVLEPCIVFAKTEKCDWESLDNQPIEFIFFIVLNLKDGNNFHMDIIKDLSKCFMDENFTKEIINIKTYEDLIAILNKFSDTKNEIDNAEIIDNQNNIYDIVAVTACPTGIAHTFMAAKKLEDTAKKMNVNIKVETQGTEGPRNVLTNEDIKNSKGVILAVDKTIDLSKFAGHKNVLEISTSSVIKDAEKQIKRSLNNEGTEMKGNYEKNESKSFEENLDLLSFNKFGKRLYKSLMTGVSYMLPFVVFGGILIALSFLIDINNPNSSNLGSSNPVAIWFKSLGDISFGLIVPILAAYVTYAIVGKLGLLPGFITGMIANGSFLFSLDPKTGTIDWLGKPDAQSGFFGAIAGAILSAAIIIVLVKYVFQKLPKSLNGIKNILFIPLFGTLLIAAIFWILNIPLIYLNYGFSELLNIINRNNLNVLIGLIIGLMMTSDLGGPINKAAYVFAITSIQTTNGGTVAMAAAMGAGMVPPLGIALCCTIFRKLWTKEELTAGYTNYVMGLSFISEGAIPFTAEKPKVLIPANLIGGAISGILIASFGIVLNAPHGGIFVIALVKSTLNSNWSPELATGAGVGLFLLSIIIGSFASCFTIYFLTKITNKSKTNKKEKDINKKNNFSNLFSKKTNNKNEFILGKNINKNVYIKYNY